MFIRFFKKVLKQLSIELGLILHSHLMYLIVKTGLFLLFQRCLHTPYTSRVLSSFTQKHKTQCPSHVSETFSSDFD